MLHVIPTQNSTPIDTRDGLRLVTLYTMFKDECHHTIVWMRDWPIELTYQKGCIIITFSVRF